MAQGKFEKDLVIATTITAIAISLALAPAVLSNAAVAQSNKSTSGNGQGTVVCPSPTGTPPTQNKPGMNIGFNSGKNKGTVSGNWQITGPFGVKAGSITGGSIGAQNFQLTGFETTDTVCFQSPGATITIRGQCGSGVTIEFEASNGERGTFVGNAFCS